MGNSIPNRRGSWWRLRASVVVAERDGSGDASRMTARAVGKTHLTRRSLIVGGVLLLLTVCGSVVLWWPQSVSLCDLKVEFVRFDASNDGGSVDYAVLNVRNESSRKWALLSARDILPMKEELVQALGRFATGQPRGESGRVARTYIGGGISHTLKTNTAEQVAVALPRIGEKGWVEIFCWTPPEVRRGLPVFVQRWWWRVRPPTSLWVWVRCEVPIQCGRERSYGKPIVPRLISEDGKTQAPQ